MVAPTRTFTSPSLEDLMWPSYRITSAEAQHSVPANKKRRRTSSFSNLCCALKRVGPESLGLVDIKPTATGFA